MRGALATLGFYTLNYPHRRKIDVDSSYFCENGARFKAQLHTLEKNEEYIASIQHYRQCSRNLGVVQQKYAAVCNETANETLRELRRARSELKRCSEARTDVVNEWSVVLPRLEASLAASEKNVDNTTARFGKGSEAHNKALNELHECKKNFAVKRRSYLGKIGRLSARIEHCTEAIGKGEEEKTLFLVKQEEQLEKAKKLLLDARRNIEAVMYKTIGSEVFIPGKILALLKQDPDVGSETVEKIIALTPNFVHTDWNVTFDPGEGTSMLISECIHDDLNQSMADLIVRICVERNCQFTDAMIVLTQLRDANQLYRVKHFCEGSWTYEPWQPKSRTRSQHQHDAAVAPRPEPAIVAKAH